MRVNSKPQKKEQPSKIRRTTDFLTDLVYFLVFFIAIPGIFAAIGAGISLLFFDETLFAGEYNLGIFLVIFFSSLPFGLQLFKLIRKKRIMYEISAQDGDWPYIYMILYLFLPICLVSTLFFVLSSWLEYSTYLSIFQIISISIFSLIGIIFTRYFHYRFQPTLTSLNQSNSEGENKVEPNGTRSITNDIIGFFGFKLFAEIIYILWGTNPIPTILIINWSFLGIFILLLLGSHLKTHLQTVHPAFNMFRVWVKNFQLNRFFLKFLPLLYSSILVVSIISSPILGFLENLPAPALYVFWGLFIGKVLLIFTTRFLHLSHITMEKYNRQVSTPTFGSSSNQNENVDTNKEIATPSKKTYPISQQILLICNKLMTFALMITILIYGYHLEYIPSGYTFISLIFIFTTAIEINQGKGFQKFGSVLTGTEIAIFAGYFSFMFLNKFILFELIIFTLLTIFIPVFLFSQKSISARIYNYFLQIQVIVVFLELGVYFGYVSSFHDLNLVLSHPWINYVFFLALSALASGYRAYFLELKLSHSKHFGVAMFIIVSIVISGFFLIIQTLFLPISEWLVNTSFSHNQRFFNPIGLFTNSERFFSGLWRLVKTFNFYITIADVKYLGQTILWNISMTSLFTLAIVYLNFKLHERFGLLSDLFINLNRLLFRVFFFIFFNLGFFLTFISFSSLLLGVIVGLSGVYFVYDALLPLILPSKTEKWISLEKLKNILAIVINFLTISFLAIVGFEFLKFSVLLTIEIVLILDLFFVNGISRLASLFESKSQYNLLQINNAILYMIMGSLLIPTIFQIDQIAHLPSIFPMVYILLNIFTISIFSLAANYCVKSSGISSEKIASWIRYGLVLLVSIVPVMMFDEIFLSDTYFLDENFHSLLVICSAIVLFLESIGFGVYAAFQQTSGKNYPRRWRYAKIAIRYLSIILILRSINSFSIFSYFYASQYRNEDIEFIFRSWLILTVFFARTYLSLREIKKYHQKYNYSFQKIEKILDGVRFVVFLHLSIGITLVSRRIITWYVPYQLNEGPFLQATLLPSIALGIFLFLKLIDISKLGEKYLSVQVKTIAKTILWGSLSLCLLAEIYVLCNMKFAGSPLENYPILTILSIFLGLNQIALLILPPIHKVFQIRSERWEPFQFSLQQNRNLSSLILLSVIPIKLVLENKIFDEIGVNISFIGLIFGFYVILMDLNSRFNSNYYGKTDFSIFQKIFFLEHVVFRILAIIIWNVSIIVFWNAQIIPIGISWIISCYLLLDVLKFISDQKPQWKSISDNIFHFVKMGRAIGILLIEFGIFWNFLNISLFGLLSIFLTTILLNFIFTDSFKLMLKERAYSLTKIFIANSLSLCIYGYLIQLLFLFSENFVRSNIYLFTFLGTLWISLSLYFTLINLSKHTLISLLTTQKALFINDFFVNFSLNAFVSTIIHAFLSFAINAFVASLNYYIILGGIFSVGFYFFIHPLHQILTDVKPYPKIRWWSQMISLLSLFTCILVTWFHYIPFNANTLLVGGGIGTVGLLFVCIPLQKILPNISKIMDTIINRSKEVILLSTAVSISWLLGIALNSLISPEFFTVSLQIIAILGLMLLMGSLGKKWILTPFITKYLDIFLALISVSIGVLTSIYTFTKIQDIDWMGKIFFTILWTIIGIFVSISSIGKKYFQKSTHLLIKQISLTILIINLALISYFAFMLVFSAGFSHILTAIIITGLILLEKRTFKIITHDSTYILQFIIHRGYLLFSIIIFVANEVFQTPQNKIYFLLLSIIVPIYLGLQYIKWKTPQIISHELTDEISNPSSPLLETPIKQEPHGDDSKNLQDEVPIEPESKLNFNWKFLQLSNVMNTHRILFEKIPVIFIALASIGLNIYAFAGNQALWVLSLLFSTSIILKAWMQYYEQISFAFLKFALYNFYCFLLFTQIQQVWDTNQNFLGLYFSIGVPVILLLILVHLGTNTYPKNGFNNFLMQLNLFGISLYILNLLDIWSIYTNLLVSALILRLATKKINRILIIKALTICVFSLWIASNINGFLIDTILHQILLAITISYLLMWIQFRRSKHPRYLLQKITGYLTLSSFAILYGYYNYYPSTWISIANPIVFLIAGISLFILRDMFESRNKKIELNVYFELTLGLFIYSLFSKWIIPNFMNAVPMSLFLTIFGMGLSIIYIFSNIEINKLKWMVFPPITLASLAFGGFITLLSIEPTLNPLPWEIALAIGFDLTILIFYLSLGFFYKSFQKMWSIGVYLWIAIPISNFILIFQALSDIDLYTRALSIFSLDLRGSVILSIVLCSLLYLPVILTKLKEKITLIIYGFWVEYIGIMIWATINLFPEADLILQIPFILMLSLIFALPFYLFRKKWSNFVGVWGLIGTSNIIWLHLFLQLKPEWQIPLDFMLGGLYILISSFFPNIRKSAIGKRITLIGGYVILYGAIFALCYSFLILLVELPMLTLNFTFIIMSFPLLLGKHFQIQEILAKILHSITIIINFGIAIGILFHLVGPEYLVFGIFLGIGTSFGLTLAFQARNYIPKFGFEVIWYLMAVSFGLSIYFFLTNLLQLGQFASIGIFLLISISIAIPVMKKYLSISLMGNLVGLALICVQLLVNTNVIFLVKYRFLLLADIVAMFELAYLYGTRKWKKRLIVNDQLNWEVFLGGTLIATILFIITGQLLIESFYPLAGIIHLCIFIDLLCISTIFAIIFIEKKKLLLNFVFIQKNHQILKRSLCLSVYFLSSFLLAYLLPGFSLIPRYPSNYDLLVKFSYFFIADFVIFYVFDKKFFTQIPNQLSLAISLGNYLGLIISSMSFLYMLSRALTLTILITSILVFPGLYLLKKRFNSFELNLAKIINFLLFQITLTLFMIDRLDLTNLFLEEIVNFEFYFLLLIIILNLGLFLGGIKSKFFSFTREAAIWDIFKISICLCLEEICRIFLNLSIVQSFSLGILLYILFTYNTIHDSKRFLVLWASFIVSVSSFAFELIRRTFITIQPGDLVFIYLFIFTGVYSAVNYRIIKISSQRQGISVNHNETAQTIESAFQSAMDQRYEQKNDLLHWTLDSPLLEKAMFIQGILYWLNIFTTGILFARYLNSNILSSFISISQPFLNFMSLSPSYLLILGFSLILGAIISYNYMNNRKIMIINDKIDAFLRQHIERLVFICGVLLSLEIFYIMSVGLKIVPSIQDVNFIYFFLALSCSFLALKLAQLFRIIPDYFNQYISFFFSLFFIGFIEEISRNYLIPSFWFNASLILLGLVLFNLQWKKKSSTLLLQRTLLATGMVFISIYLLNLIKFQNSSIFTQVSVYLVSISIIYALNIHFFLVKRHTMEILAEEVLETTEPEIERPEKVVELEIEDQQIDSPAVIPAKLWHNSNYRNLTSLLFLISGIFILTGGFLLAQLSINVFSDIFIANGELQNLLQYIPDYIFSGIFVFNLILGLLVLWIYIINREIFLKMLKINSLMQNLLRWFITISFFMVPCMLAFIFLIPLALLIYPFNLFSISMTIIFLFTVWSQFLLNLRNLQEKSLFSSETCHKVLFIHQIGILISSSISSYYFFALQNIYLSGAIFGGCIYIFIRNDLLPLQTRKILPIIANILIESALIGFILSRLNNELELLNKILIFVIMLHLIVEANRYIPNMIKIYHPLSFIRIITWAFIIIAIDYRLISLSLSISLIQRIFLVISITFAMLFYENYISLRVQKQLKYRIVKEVLIISFVVSIIGVILTFIYPLNIGMIISDDYSILFNFIFTAFIASILLNAAIILEQKFPLDLVKSSILHIKWTSIVLSLVLFASQGFYILFTTVKFPSLPSGNPYRPSSGLLEQIMFPLLIISIIVFGYLILKYKNRKLNQILYFVVVVELLILFSAMENYTLLVIFALISLISYPLLFIFEQFVLFLKNIVEYLSNAMQYIKSILIKMGHWIKATYLRYKIPFYLILAGGLSTLSYFYLYPNYFFSGLVFLVVYLPISPEFRSKNTELDFGKKIVYRGLFAVTAVGSAYPILPQEIWIYLLFILAFLGYILWLIRKSEEIYNLSIYWRLFISIAAIIDFILMVGFILNRFGILNW